MGSPEDDNDTNLDVLMNIYSASNQIDLLNSQLAHSTIDESCCVLLHDA